MFARTSSFPRNKEISELSNDGLVIPLVKCLLVCLDVAARDPAAHSVVAQRDCAHCFLAWHTSMHGIEQIAAGRQALQILQRA